MCTAHLLTVSQEAEPPPPRPEADPPGRVTSDACWEEADPPPRGQNDGRE